MPFFEHRVISLVRKYHLYCREFERGINDTGRKTPIFHEETEHAHCDKLYVRMRLTS